MPETSIKDFEAAIAELETIVKKLEEGELTLEQSLGLYERGVQLSRFCHARLEQAERRIEILNERGAARRPRREEARRGAGRPTPQVVYGEGVAIVAGDGLQAGAFGRGGREPMSIRDDSDINRRKLRVLRLVAEAAGAPGMVGGQA